MNYWENWKVKQYGQQSKISVDDLKADLWKTR